MVRHAQAEHSVKITRCLCPGKEKEFTSLFLTVLSFKEGDWGRGGCGSRSKIVTEFHTALRMLVQTKYAQEVICKILVFAHNVLRATA